MNPVNPLTSEDVITLVRQFFASKNPEIISSTLTPFSKDTHRLLTIQAQELNYPETRRTLKFFVKLLGNMDNKFMSDIFSTESKFFSEIVPKLRINSWSPKCYLTKSNAIVLEDLRSLGFESPNKLLNEDQMRLAITSVPRIFDHSRKFIEQIYLRGLSGIFPEQGQTDLARDRMRGRRSCSFHVESQPQTSLASLRDHDRSQFYN